LEPLTLWRSSLRQFSAFETKNGRSSTLFQARLAVLVELEMADEEGKSCMLDTDCERSLGPRLGCFLHELPLLSEIVCSRKNSRMRARFPVHSQFAGGIWCWKLASQQDGPSDTRYHAGEKMQRATVQKACRNGQIVRDDFAVRLVHTCWFCSLFVTIGLIHWPAGYTV